MLAAIDEPGTTLVDVRSPAEYVGELAAPSICPRKRAQRKGHIPGAVNVPWAKAVAEDGTFKPDEELERALRRQGRHARQGGHRLLPHRRALEPHVVRAVGAARLPDRAQLRRQLDRVRLARRRADRARRSRLTSTAVKRPSKADLDTARDRTIEDLIAPDLSILFVGINPGTVVGRDGFHFARPGNRFWHAIHQAGLTPLFSNPPSNASCSTMASASSTWCRARRLRRPS